MVQTPNSFLFGFRRDRIPLWLWTLDFGGGAEQSRAGGNEKGGLVCLTRLQELLCCHGAPKEEAARREEEQQQPSMAAFLTLLCQTHARLARIAGLPGDML